MINQYENILKIITIVTYYLKYAYDSIFINQ